MQFLHQSPPVRGQAGRKWELCPFVFEKQPVSLLCTHSSSMYASMRAPVPGVKSYWRNKECLSTEEMRVRTPASFMMTTLSSSRLIEGTKKKNPLLIKTQRLGYWQGWGPNACQFPKLHWGVIITTWWWTVKSCSSDCQSAAQLLIYHHLLLVLHLICYFHFKINLTYYLSILLNSFLGGGLLYLSF